MTTVSTKTLTDTEILDFIVSKNFACLFVMSSGQRFQFGPGELGWQRALRTATVEQRELLSEKIARWQKRSA